MTAPLVARVEAVLFLAEEPVSVAALAEAADAPPADVEAALADIGAACAATDRGLVLLEAAGGWRLYTDPEVNETVERFALSGRTGRLTQAALETLSVVAYKQPISRQELSDVRGVQADAALRSLEQRGLVAEVGTQEGPGQAALFGTTPLFLEKLGINTIADLPPLTEWLPEEAAPDEPGDLRAARTRVAAGEPLPSSWRDGAPAGDQPGPRTATAEIEELTSALESAAGDAVARLRDVMAATREDTADEPEDAEEAGNAAGEASHAAEEASNATAEAANAAAEAADTSNEPAAEGSPASS